MKRSVISNSRGLNPSQWIFCQMLIHIFLLKIQTLHHYSKEGYYIFQNVFNHNLTAQQIRILATFKIWPLPPTGRSWVCSYLYIERALYLVGLWHPAWTPHILFPMTDLMVFLCDKNSSDQIYFSLLLQVIIIIHQRSVCIRCIGIVHGKVMQEIGL